MILFGSNPVASSLSYSDRALFNLGDLASPLFESDLRSVILFGSNPTASSLSDSVQFRGSDLSAVRK